MMERHRERIRKLSDKRVHLPAEEPYMEGHNTWCVNVPGSLLVIPVADLAQHLIAIVLLRSERTCSTTMSTIGRSRDR